MGLIDCKNNSDFLNDNKNQIKIKRELKRENLKKEQDKINEGNEENINELFSDEKIKIDIHHLEGNIKRNDKTKEKSENSLSIIELTDNKNESCDFKGENEEYNESILKIINRIRAYPREYAKEIEKNMQFIKQFAKDCFIFEKNNIKVALYKGKEAFIKAKKDLESMTDSIPQLEIKDDLKIEIPNNINEDYLKNQNYLCFKDFINIPEISILLMIIDDTWDNSYVRRNAILNKDYKYIGINSQIIDKKFISIFSFSKGDI